MCIPISLSLQLGHLAFSQLHYNKHSFSSSIIHQKFHSYIYNRSHVMRLSCEVKTNQQTIGLFIQYLLYICHAWAWANYLSCICDKKNNLQKSTTYTAPSNDRKSCFENKNKRKQNTKKKHRQFLRNPSLCNTWWSYIQMFNAI